MRNVWLHKIYYNICKVYGLNVMREGLVRKWVRMFNGGRNNIHNAENSGYPSLAMWKFGAQCWRKASF